VHILNGLVALTRTGITVVAPSGTLVHLSLAGLGWSLLISGLVLAAVGAGIFTGQTWARVLGMVLAVLSILGNIAVFMAFPAWSALVITLDVVVLYALAAHGREINHHSTRA
jgi:UDP-N-acetylmuramyl pentapeptide phosphotransferase/UDP-N-acetylglucosamine-1-phosphate transferase